MKTRCFLLWLTALMLTVSACHHDAPTPEPRVAGQTIVVLMPWSFSLNTFFEKNLQEMEEVVAAGGLANERVVVCFASTSLKSTLFELRAEQGRCVRDTIQVFNSINFTVASNITKMLAEVERAAPAHHYALIMAGHGMAWLPAGRSPMQYAPPRQVGKHYLTRWVGGYTKGTQIEIGTLAQGISLAGMHMDYILFDDCYMSSVEVAYELREVADYIVGCPSEIMAYGFPYKQCMRYLLGSPDYQRLCETFLDFYTHYEVACGTVAVTDCRELEALADVARSINLTFPTTQEHNDDIQQMDGFEPTLFYDLGDTYAHLCEDKALLEAFNRQLERTVPYKACTAYYYTALEGHHIINHYSGLSTSQTSGSPLTADWSGTPWGQAVTK